MAGNIKLYLQQSPESDRVGSIIASQVNITETAYYNTKSVAKEAVVDATQGTSVIIAVPSTEFCAIKLALLKNLSVRVLRSSKISAQIGDKLADKPKEFNIQTAIPQDSETFVSADGLYSAFACKALKGVIVVIPSDEYKLQEALDMGAVLAVVPAKNSKAKMAECVNAIILSGKKIAVADFGKASALMSSIESVNPEQSTFTTVTALTDKKLKAKDFEANLAKSAKETGDYDYGVVVSNLGEDGVTIAVADSETARVEVIHSQPGEDAKKLMAAAVIRLCEITQEATEDGIEFPEGKITSVSKSAFYIIVSCLSIAIIACIVICVLLFAKESKNSTQETAQIATEVSSVSELIEMGGVELFPEDDNEIIDTENNENSNSTLQDLFDNYTTYKGQDNEKKSDSVFTTTPVDYKDSIIDVTTSVSTTIATTVATTIRTVTRPVLSSYRGNESNSTTESTTEEITETTTKPTTTKKEKTTKSSNQLKGKFVFTVYGWGHGVGMSQDGAIAFAKQGKTCNEILCHYYPGVTIMTDKNTPMYVTKPDANGKGGETLVSFLCKTVKQEIGDLSPYEALKAQAICAYTYAMNHKNFGAGQTMDRNFKYKGTQVEKAVFEVLHITNESQQPHCDYLSYDGKYVNAVYCANIARTTTSSVNAWGGAKIPYLLGGISTPENVMVSTYEVSAKEMKNLIIAYAGDNVKFDKNPARWIKILNHDGAYSNGIGYIGEIDMCGIIMSGNRFRTKVMGGHLKSHCFTIEYVLE